MNSLGKKLAFLLAMAVVLGAAIAVGYAAWSARPSTTDAESVPAVISPGDGENAGEGELISVKTIKPKRDPNFIVSVDELASVRPYFQADLYARVAGPVKFIQKDKGDRIKMGEVLAEIDVPDYVQDIAQKESVITQRQMEMQAARAKVGVAEAEMEVAKKNIAQREAEVNAATATKEYRKLVLDRFTQLAQREAITDRVIDEQRKDYLSAAAACDSAAVAVEKARVDFEESKANLAVVLADIKIKESLVEVARQDRDLAVVRAELAKIRAPFDGVIVERHVDPGSFVQNATTAHTAPLITVAMLDKVTVTSKIPDNYVPFISDNTSVVIHIGGQRIEGKVTRRVPAIADKDRTMEVEADLFNGTEDDYLRYVGKALAKQLMPVGVTQALPAVTLAATGQAIWEPSVKGAAKAFPLFPKVQGKAADRFKKLVPGMSGYMRLMLQSGDAFLLPSGAVFTRGGKQYVLIVKNNVAHLAPVDVQADDGKLSKVALLVRIRDAKGGSEEVVKELDGSEEIIANGQGEIGDSQAVRPTLIDW
jgi:multidrug resistance efflux pump